MRSKRLTKSGTLALTFKNKALIRAESSDESNKFGSRGLTRFYV